MLQRFFVGLASGDLAMRGVHGLLAIGCVWVALGGAYSQVPQLEPGSQAPNLEPDHPEMKNVPTVTFERVYPDAEPEHYVISVESSGNAAYHSEKAYSGSGDDVAGEEPYILKFTVSGDTSSRIFELTRKANYFKSSGDHSSLPDSGNSTLTYSEGPTDSFGHSVNGVRNWVSYDNSADPAIRQLASLFAEISNSLELGREIESLHRSHRAGLEAALKRAEDNAANHGLLELQAIAVSLKGVADDPGVSDVARQRAQRLLMLAGASPAQGSR